MQHGSKDEEQDHQTHFAVGSVVLVKGLCLSYTPMHSLYRAKAM